MENNIKDTNQNSGVIFFIILFSLSVLIFSGRSETQTSASSRFSLQNEMAFGNISDHFVATLFNALSLPDLYKNCVISLYNKSFNPFSIQNKISDYNRRVAQNFILIQKTRLTIEPALPLRLYFHLPSNKDDYLPVLG
jgi:hypothetical protein